MQRDIKKLVDEYKQGLIDELDQLKGDIDMELLLDYFNRRFNELRPYNIGAYEIIEEFFRLNKCGDGHKQP